MTTFYLIRHGTNDFTGKRLVGRTPGVHLNDEGRRQAEAVAAALNKIRFTAIFSSPLERAMETAAPLAAFLGIPVQPHEGLQEVDFGDWQGYTARKMQRLKLFKTAQVTPSLVRFPGGESYAEAQQRVVKTLMEISLGNAENDAIACFSHCDVIRLAIAHLVGMPLDAFQSLTVDTGSISILKLNEQRHQLLKLNAQPGAL